MKFSLEHLLDFETSHLTEHIISRQISYFSQERVLFILLEHIARYNVCVIDIKERNAEKKEHIFCAWKKKNYTNTSCWFLDLF